MELTQITLAGRSIPLAIKRHAKARRISLRLSPARDGVVLTLPRRASVQAGIAFFRSKADWVLASVDAAGRILLTDGTVIPVLGRDYTIHYAGLRGTARLCDETGQLLIYGDPAFTPRRARDFLKKHLRHYALEKAGALAAQLGATLQGITIRDTQSRWGSCSARGRISLTWQLVFAPPEVVDYIIAHESAHLKEMNHSDRFWRCVAQLCPDYAVPCRWLKQQGYLLHRYK